VNKDHQYLVTLQLQEENRTPKPLNRLS